MASRALGKAQPADWKVAFRRSLRRASQMAGAGVLFLAVLFLGLALALTVASGAALVVYLAYSRLVRLPELPRTLGLLRAALRPG